MLTRTSTTTAERLDPALVKLALTIVVGVIAAILDLTVVNVAITALQHDLHADVSTIQWVSTGYALAVAVTIPATGWLFERLGARRAWLLALTVFVVGSALCAAAWSPASLIVFRVLQGVGGGMLLPLAQTILANEAGPTRLARVVPYIAIPSQLGPVLGPVLGGAILSIPSHSSWRLIFLINVPIIAIAVILGRRVVPARSTATAAARRLDLLGLALLSPALALLVFGFSQAGTSGGFDGTGVRLPLAAGVALLVGYSVRALRSRIEPPLNLRFLRARGYSTASALMFGSGITLFGALFLLPLFYQQQRGASALEAGLLLAPQGLGMAIGAVLAGRTVNRFGTRTPALIGLTLLIVATVPFVVAENAGGIALGIATAIRGVGLGLTLIPVTTASYAGLPRDAVASVTTGVKIFQQVGGALGTAVLAVVLQHTGSFTTTFAWVLGFTVLSLVPAALLPGAETVDHKENP